MADRFIMDSDSDQQEQKPSVFKRQLFGPWTNYDPKVQQQIVRTRPTSGTTQRRFASTAPPAPLVSQHLTAIAGGWQFAVQVSSGSIVGYNVYTSNVKNAAIATLLDHKSQPPIVTPAQTIQFQYITTTSPFYWVSAVNAAGQESARIAVGGTSPVANPSKPLPVGGGSGLGSGGGRGGGVYNWKVRQL